MTKIIRMKHIDPSEVPELLHFQRKEEVLHYLEKIGLDKCEEICQKDIQAIEILIEELISQERKLEAFSVYTRHMDKLEDTCTKMHFKEKEELEYIPSKLWKNDAFLPYSVIKDFSLKEKYLKLKDLGIFESNIEWIDSKNMEHCREVFLNEDVVGLDCEFRDTNCTRFSELKIALLQVASSKKCVLFDVKSLESSPIFITWLQNLLRSGSIIKVGFGFREDIRILQETLKVKLEPCKLIEIDSLDKSNKKLGLRGMVQAHLGKEFCKFNQVSSWFQRPLRKSQLHYAALDAAVMIPLWEKLKGKINPENNDFQEPINIKKKKKKKKKTKKKTNQTKSKSEKFLDNKKKTKESYLSMKQNQKTNI